MVNIMPYRITNYTKEQAKKLGVVVKPSTNKDKKIDVYKDDKKIASVGALHYPDYPNYLKLEKMGRVPKGYADDRRRNYKSRHEKDRNVKNSRGYYADKLLW